MHPDLSSHLHTEECNKIIEAFKNCHKEHPYSKFLGKCNDFDRAMNKCLHKERIAKREANKNSRRKHPTTANLPF